MTKKNTKAHLSFAKKHFDDPQTFGKIFSEIPRQKMNFLEGMCLVIFGIKLTQHFTKRISYQQSNIVVVVWWSGAASGPGWFPSWMEVFDGIMNSTLYQKILKENVWAISLWPQAQTCLSYAGGQWSKTHQQVYLWLAKKNKTLRLKWFGMALHVPFMLKSPPVWLHWKKILQKKVGQNSSTVMWKTHYQLLKMLDRNNY